MSHAWTPSAPGDYDIRMEVTDRSIETTRLDSGFYRRTVRITEV